MTERPQRPGVRSLPTRYEAGVPLPYRHAHRTDRPVRFWRPIVAAGLALIIGFALLRAYAAVRQAPFDDPGRSRYELVVGSIR